MWSLPTARSQRYLALIGAAGVFTACFGCGLAARNEVNASTIFLIVAQLILLPLFLYLLTIRRGTKRIVRRRSAERQAELDAVGRMFESRSAAAPVEGESEAEGKASEPPRSPGT